jgi:hypothetical protein
MNTVLHTLLHAGCVPPDPTKSWELVSAYWDEHVVLALNNPIASPLEGDTRDFGCVD